MTRSRTSSTPENTQPPAGTLRAASAAELLGIDPHKVAELMRDGVLAGKHGFVEVQSIQRYARDRPDADSQARIAA